MRVQIRLLLLARQADQALDAVEGLEVGMEKHGNHVGMDRIEYALLVERSEALRREILWMRRRLAALPNQEEDEDR